MEKYDITKVADYNLEFELIHGIWAWEIKKPNNSSTQTVLDMIRAMVQRTDVWGYYLRDDDWPQAQVTETESTCLIYQSLEQGSVNLISEGKLINISGFVGHDKVSLKTTPLWHISIKAAMDNIQMNVPDCVSVKLYL